MPWNNNDPAKRSRDSRVYNADYRRKRLACLRAAKWRCEIRLEGCQGAASQADHQDGADQDLQHRHLRAACTSCHRKVTAQQGGGYRTRAAAADPQPRPRTAW